MKFTRKKLVWLLMAGGVLALPAAALAAEPPTRFIIKWKDAQPRAQALSETSQNFAQHTGRPLHAKRQITAQLEVVQTDTALHGAALVQALNQLRAQSNVEYVAVDERRHAQTTMPNDTYLTPTSNRSGQWYLLNTEVAAINAVNAWDYSQGGAAGAGVIVAVVDSGVRPEHPDLSSKLLPGRDFVDCDQKSCTGSGLSYFSANDGDGWDADPTDPGDWIDNNDLTNHPTVFPSIECSVAPSSWHGTRVAGIIGAATNNGSGIAGIGWNARILPVRVLGKCGGYDSDIIAGMRWAAGLPVAGVPTNANPAKVINLSLGSANACSQAYQSLINSLTAMDVTVVSSAGNDSADINTPANCSGVVSVVGVRNTGTKVGFSSLGAATLAAPAGNCVNQSGACLFSLDTTTNLGSSVATFNDYTDMSNPNLGTSFSAPLVTGTIALMLGANPALTPAQIINTLRSTAKPFPATAPRNCQVPTGSTVITGINDAECNCSTSTCGAGLLDAYQAVLSASGVSSSSSSSSASSSVTSSSSSGGGGGAWSGLWLIGLAAMTCVRRRSLLRLSLFD